jgi:hypothetical protein
VTRAAPEVVWELIADADSHNEWGPWRASGYQRPGVMSGPARTHAAARCANAAVHTFSCAPNLSDLEGIQMTTTSTGLVTTVYPALAAVPRADLITSADPRYAGAPRSWGQR